MNSQTFVIVSPSKILREGLFSFLRDNGYSSYCIHKLPAIDDMKSLDIMSDEMVLILDDARLSPESIYSILADYSSPSPKLKIVVVSLTLNVNYIEKIVTFPHTGFVFHSDLDQHLLGVIDMLNFGMMSISPTALRLYLDAKRILELGNITDTDLKVLNCIACGLSVDDMVTELNMSQRTLYRIRHKLREVLDAPNSESIIDRARQLGLLT